MFKFLPIALFLAFACLILANAQTKRTRGGGRGGKTSYVPRRILDMKTKSSINILLVKATYVEIGFSFIQGAHGFMVLAKEWIDGKFEQSVATDRQKLDVQRRSAILTNLIPGRDYLIQVQALSKSMRPFGAVQEKIVRTSQMCYVCNGVETNDECNSESDAVECPSDKDACLNVVRYDNDRMSITKRCGQFVQKFAEKTSAASCSGPDSKDSVCRCMCRSNLCNGLVLPCVDECLDDLPKPMKSTLKCTKGRKINSVCKWHCPKGYILKGVQESRCREDRTWSVMSPPQCIHKADPRIPKPSPRAQARAPGITSIRQQRLRNCPAPEITIGLEMKCTNGRKPNSVCSFSCKAGFEMIGDSSVRVCRKAKWTGTDISCKEILCPSVTSESGFMNCSNSEKIGSICNFARPYTKTCQLDGTWTSSSACDAAELYDFGGSRYTECESLHTPPYGNVECSDGWKEGSVCSYTCAKGYTIVGETYMRRCSKGQWSGSPATCQEITCGSLDSEESVKNIISCSDDNKVGSVCEVLTPAQVTCQVGGTWSTPFKQHKKCEECSCP